MIICCDLNNLLRLADAIRIRVIVTESLAEFGHQPFGFASCWGSKSDRKARK